LGAFQYSALDSNGHLNKGVLEAESPRQLRQIIREKGLTLVAVEEVSGSRKVRSLFFLQKRLSSTDLALFTRQLATLIRSGVPLEEALQAVAEQTEKSAIKGVLVALRARIMEGYSMARALDDFPAIFSGLYRATVDAGEQVGHLDIIFERLADYTEFRQQIRQKIILALIYPALLTVVAFTIIGALLAYVVPQVVTVFQSVGQELPILTRGLIFTSEALKEYGIFLLLIAVLTGISWTVALRNPKLRFSFHKFLLSLPLAGKFIKTVNAANFARSFSILTASGVSVVEGMHLSAKVIWALPIREAVVEASTKVREGESLHRSLAKSGYLPPISIHLIASGESSSKLEEMLDKAAQIQEHEIETLVAATLGIFEPLLILVMGGIVLAIVMAILLPILDMNQLVR